VLKIAMYNVNGVNRRRAAEVDAGFRAREGAGDPAPAWIELAANTA
jgi:hypothetical protein